MEVAPWAFPTVIVYSPDDLALDDIGNPEHRIGDEPGAFRYRYDQLRLFVQDNGHIFLWSTTESPRTGMFVLHESDDIRLVYQPELRGGDPGAVL